MYLRLTSKHWSFLLCWCMSPNSDLDSILFLTCWFIYCDTGGWIQTSAFLTIPQSPALQLILCVLILHLETYQTPLSACRVVYRQWYHLIRDKLIPLSFSDILNSSGENEHQCLALDLRGKAFSPLPYPTKLLVLSFCRYASPKNWITSIHNLSFYHKWDNGFCWMIF